MTLFEAIQADSFLNFLAFVLSAGAVLVSWLSWKRAGQATRASLFERRFEVYRDADQFLLIWAREGCPDMEKLHLIVGAHDRSHFLFENDVVAFLRLLWLDAVKSDHFNRIVTGNAPGNRDEAIEEQYHLFKRYCGEENVLRNTFLPAMKIGKV